MITSRKMRSNKNLFIAAVLLSLLSMASPALGIHQTIFPMAEVIMSNDSEGDVQYMCKFDDQDESFHLLRKGEKIRWKFRQVVFPLRWCYLYYNDKKHGFFWAFSMRYGCNPCVWSIRNDPYLFHRERALWLVTYLHPIPVKKLGR